MYVGGLVGSLSRVGWWIIMRGFLRWPRIFISWLKSKEGSGKVVAL
jgi:hypothetical protein